MKIQYVALEPDGREITGVLEASTTREAIRKLSENGRIPVSANPVEIDHAVSLGNEARAVSRPRRSKLNGRKLAAFYKRLSQLLGAGVPLVTALASLSRSSEAAEVAQIFGDVKSGVSLSDAMRKCGDPFEPFHLALVQAGEVSGDLKSALEDLATQLERTIELRATLSSSLVYPALLLAVSCIVFSMLMIFVVPRFESLFADANSALPLATRIVIDFAAIVKLLWWVPLTIFVLGFFAMRFFRGNEQLETNLSNMLLRLPIIGNIKKELESIRFARSLGVLLNGGASALEAVSFAGKAMKSPAYQARADRVYGHIVRGEKLSNAVSVERLGNDEFVEIVRVGESTGGLGPVLIDAALIYESDLTRRLKAIVAMVEPIIIMTLGLLIGAVVISLFIGVLSVNDLAF